MADYVMCENCKTEEKRKIGACAPEKWFYFETKEYPSGQEGIVWFCSLACIHGLLRVGPGNLKQYAEFVEERLENVTGLHLCRMLDKLGYTQEMAFNVLIDALSLARTHGFDT